MVRAPLCDWEAHDLELYLPPAFRLYKDMINRRWQIACEWRSWSRSWTLRPSAEAARETIREAWSGYIRAYGGVCLVTDLFEVGV